MLSMGLMLTLSKTDAAGPVIHPEHDPFLVRFYVVLLATTMAVRGRDHLSVIKAWEEAIANDPLPESRPARAIALTDYRLFGSRRVLLMPVCWRRFLRFVARQFHQIRCRRTPILR